MACITQQSSARLFRHPAVVPVVGMRHVISVHLKETPFTLRVVLSTKYDHDGILYADTYHSTLHVLLIISMPENEHTSCAALNHP